MDSKEIRHANLLALEDQFGSLQALAERTHSDAKYLSQLKNRWQGRGMGDELARQIESMLGKPRGWMDTYHPIVAEPGEAYGLSPIRAWEHQDDLPPGEYAFIPRLEVHLSGGNGREQMEIEFVQQQPQAFRADWIRKMKLRPAKLAVMTVAGDSMEERLHEGDAVVVDTSQIEVIDGKVYALWYDGGERVKRLYRRPGCGLVIRSDNEARYPPLTLSPEEAHLVRIIGRVVHVAGEGGL